MSLWHQDGEGRSLSYLPKNLRAHVRPKFKRFAACGHKVAFPDEINNKGRQQQGSRKPKGKEQGNGKVLKRVFPIPNGPHHAHTQRNQQRQSNHSSYDFFHFVNAMRLAWLRSSGLKSAVTGHERQTLFTVFRVSSGSRLGDPTTIASIGDSVKGEYLKCWHAMFFGVVPVGRVRQRFHKSRQDKTPV